MNRKVPDTKSIVLSPDSSSIKCKTFPLRPTQATDYNRRETRTPPRNNFAIVQELVHNVCCAPARGLSGWSSVSSASNNGSDNPVCVSDGQPAWIEEPLLPGPCWRDKNYWGNDNDTGPCHLNVSMISLFSISPKPFDFSVQHQTLWTRATSVIIRKYLLPGKQEEMQTVGLHLQNISRLKLRNQLSFCFTRVTYLHN